MKTAVALTLFVAIGCQPTRESPPTPEDSVREEPARAAHPVSGRLLTRWARQVDPTTVHGEYPRPQLVREEWAGLNGLWELAITPADDPEPASYDREILVPFPVESALSGVAERVGEERRAWYRRRFEVPDSWAGRRVLLHFGAVDWAARVEVDGTFVGAHSGGYDPFSFDVTDALRGDGDHELVVSVVDPTDRGPQPRGKQREVPEGIWYTPTTGIWQTVWLEPVPERSIRGLRMTPDLAGGTLTVEVDVVGGSGTPPNVAVVARAEGEEVALGTGAPGAAIVLRIDAPRPWSPDDPFLYDLEVRLADGSDRVTSYFGMRSIELARDQNGIVRMFFNGAPLFQFGPLDQGFWPDGLYTAPCDEALRYDLEVTKRFGFNMVRKHVKVEPARWYYWCDKLGLLVWQDMPNGDRHAHWPLDGTEIERTDESREIFDREIAAVMNALHNHPSIVVWVPFNEAWGQFDTLRVTRGVKQADPSRLVICASGGNDFAVGDINDDHFYPGPGAPPAQIDRAAVLGEYGGLGLPLSGHTWQDEKNWGYRSFKDVEKLTAAYVGLVGKLRKLVESRLSAAVYTQTTDVEIEINGLMTYDRAVIKMDAERIAAANRELYRPLPSLSAAERTAAYVLAHWRFEDGEPGARVPNVQDVPDKTGVPDTSGHKNHMWAFGRPQSPAYSSEVPAAKLADGRANRGSLDDTTAPGGTPTRDLFSDPRRSKTHMDVVNTFPFAQWTVEASVRLSELGREHGILGKDGKPTEAPAAPLQLFVDAENRVQLVAIDGSGTVRAARFDTALEAERWVHVAATSDGHALRLWVDTGDGAGYVQRAETAFDGPLVTSVGTWTIGRGFHGGRMGRDARAWIDEVRISATALRPAQFLFADK